MTDKTTHYAAYIKIERVDLEEASSAVGGRGLTTPVPATKRKVGEVSQITVKAPTMEILKRRIQAHVEVVEDDVPLDEKRGGLTRG
jgi:hypothetical protein